MGVGPWCAAIGPKVNWRRVWALISALCRRKCAATLGLWPRFMRMDGWGGGVRGYKGGHKGYVG